MKSLRHLPTLGLIILLNACNKDDNKPKYFQAGPTKFVRISETTCTLESSLHGEAIDEVQTVGFCFDTSSEPTRDASTMNFIEVDKRDNKFQLTLEGLTPNTRYYFRSFAKAASYTSYGSTIDYFTKVDTPLYVNGSGISDIDSNFYQTIVVNGMEWMKSNLRVTKLNDGTSLVYDEFWQSRLGAAYTYYNSIKSNAEKFGALYNWDAVSTGKLCPVGWHIASEDEWNRLIEFVGGDDVAGGRLKATSNEWEAPNERAANVAGLEIMPSGSVTSAAASFHLAGKVAFFWLPQLSQYRSDLADNIILSYDERFIRREGSTLDFGNSCRCVKDQ